MESKFIKLIENVSTSFVDAWNNEDFDKIICLLHPNIMLTSPQVKNLYPEKNSDQIIGSKQAIEYWKLLCARVGFFKMKQIYFEKNDRKITTKYEVIGTKIIIQSIF